MPAMLIPGQRPVPAAILDILHDQMGVNLQIARPPLDLKVANGLARVPLPNLWKH